MTEDLLRLIPLISGAMAFVLIASLWMGGVVLWAQARKKKKQFMEHRLGLHDDRQDESGYRVLHLWRDGQTESTLVAGESRRTGKLQMICDTMQWNISGNLLFLCLGGLFLACATAGFILFGDLLLGIASGGGVVFLVWSFLTGKIASKNNLFEGQLADALGLASRSLSAGHPLSGAFRVIAEEMEDPIRTVFTDLGQKQDLGLSLEQALRIMADQSSQKDLKMFAATIMIQMQSGGNLADTMARLAEVMRDRIRLARKARALTAQAQLSKRILIGVPFVTAVMLQMASPEYLGVLFETPTGRLLLGAALVLLLMGSWTMNKMADLKY